MRLAYICADSGVPVFGRKGASVHVQEVLRALARRGASIELFAARAGGDAPPALSDVPVHPLPAPATESAATRERESIAANDALRDALSTAGPFEVIYERHSLWSFAGMEYARSAGIPSLLEVNAPLIDEQAAHRVLADRSAAERCAARAFDAPSAILAVSREVAEYARRFGRRTDIHVVPNGVDPDRFAPDIPPVLPAAPGVLTLGFAGTLKPWHGIDVLVEVFERVTQAMPDARLLVVGDGPEGEALERQARRFGRALVRTGAVPPADMPGLLTSMDVAVAPYPDRRDFYFSPLKIFEYMAAGRPIVASRIGQIFEILEHDATALLCPAGDAEAFADAVLTLFADAARRRTLGSAARSRACQSHTWEAVAQQIESIANAARPPHRMMPARRPRGARSP